MVCRDIYDGVGRCAPRRAYIVDQHVVILEMRVVARMFWGGLSGMRGWPLYNIGSRERSWIIELTAFCGAIRIFDVWLVYVDAVMMMFAHRFGQILRGLN